MIPAQQKKRRQNRTKANEERRKALQPIEDLIRELSRRHPWSQKMLGDLEDKITDYAIEIEGIIRDEVLDGLGANDGSTSILDADTGGHPYLRQMIAAAGLDAEFYLAPVFGVKIPLRNAELGDGEVIFDLPDYVSGDPDVRDYLLSIRVEALEEAARSLKNTLKERNL